MKAVNIKDPIDAVITWVNGSDKNHLIMRKHYMAQSEKPLHKNAINPHRWICSDEIFYCLKSIEYHAPWTRKIWIIVDEKAPDLSSLSDFLQSKIHITYHHEIFVGFEDILPTFNSLAIETMLWRIEGLAEQFMYFNDDVFLTAPLAPQDVFVDKKPVLRGRWMNYSYLEHDLIQQDNPANFNHYMQINAAKMMGFKANRLFNAAHVVHPVLRSRMKQLFNENPEAFLTNIKHRFRDLTQFLPQGLHNHFSISNGQAVFHPSHDHLHIESGQGSGQPAKEVWALLNPITETNNIKMLCINDLPQLQSLIPGLGRWLNSVVGDY